jgi:CHAD domain-containing protein
MARRTPSQLDSSRTRAARSGLRLTPSQLDSSRTRAARSGRRLALTPQLEHLRASVEAARATLDPEAIHQARVASRRLRVFLTLAEVPVLRDDLRWLARALSRLRDLDVVRGEGLRGPFRRWLEGQHAEARHEASVVLQHPRLEGLVMALASIEPVSRRKARTQRDRLVGEVDDAWAALSAAQPPQALDALHRLRRRARSARYANEWLGLDATPFRRLQEAAGAACDVMALAALVEAYGQATKAASADAVRLEAMVREQLVPALLAHRSA